MFLRSPSKIGPEAIAVVTGGFLAGAMADLSLVVIQVLIDTVSDPRLMVAEWADVYFYGHIVYPAVCVTTVLLYLYAAYTKRASGLKWRTWVLAAIVTIAMVPFTWIFMAPTNDMLFERNDRGRAGEELSYNEVVELLVIWRALHGLRCLFPLTGAGIGLLGNLQILAL